MKKVLFLLSELNDDDIDWLVRVGQRQEIPSGSTLIYEGQPVDTLYILLEGTLVVSISALEGRQLARLSSGDVVGEMSFVDSRPPSATVQTMEESLVLSIPRSLLAEKLQFDVGFAARFYKALAILLSYRLRGTVKQLSDDTEKPPTEAEPIDRTAVEAVALAEARFDWLLRRLKNGDMPQ